MYLPAATNLGQGNALTGVCFSVQEGVCLSACWDTDTPQEHTTSQKQTTNPRIIADRLVQFMQKEHIFAEIF